MTRLLLFLFCMLLDFSAGVGAYADPLSVVQKFAELDSRLNADLILELKNDLKFELSHQVKTLRRPVEVFHYGNRGRIQEPNGIEQTFSVTKKINEDEAMFLPRGGHGDQRDMHTPVELNPPEAATYFQAMSNQFFTSAYKWNVGGGLYAATDPVQSEDYMGTPWFLLKLELPVGFRYLDVSQGESIYLSKGFVEKWDLPFEHSESLPDGTEVVRFSIHFFLKQPKVKRVVKNLFEELKIDALEYPWRESKLALCRGFQEGLKPAFNFIHPGELERGVKLQLFVRELEPNATAEKQSAYAHVLDLIETGLFEPTYLAQGKLGEWANEVSSRTQVLSWNHVLRRPSPLEFILAPEGLRLLEGGVISSAALQFPIERSFINPPLLNRALVGIRVTLQYDPAQFGFASKSNLAAKRNVIERSIYGCNPAYPEELKSWR